jgi:hypothetical protein
MALPPAIIAVTIGVVMTSRYGLRRMWRDAAGDALPISAARDLEIVDDYWVPRRRAQEAIGTCHLCLKVEPLSFEHVPPRAAFNSSRVDIQGLEHWLSRSAGGAGLRKTIQQGGQGLQVFCAQCNSETGSWYASELTGWVHGAVAAMRALPPIGEMDQELEPHVVRLRINQVRPLAFVKQIITMVLAVNDIGFAERHAALRRFVLERDQRGLPTMCSSTWRCSAGRSFDAPVSRASSSSKPRSSSF